ncbi:LysR family transcriptional regulator [Massilia niastensis]|uniref:LysR family transcriptional regulator n=1 Tax=Massilia niastensis TaxID=544911 RepID=UPI00036B749C|nr:LysR family transcriptional regulator [Massilia niastensis]
MKDISPVDLNLFLCIARHRSFTRAAVEMNVSPSALSHALRTLEERLGLRLFNRTTRSVALTAAGERLYARLAPAFQDIADALEDLNSFRGKPSGLLRLSAGRIAARMVLLPVVARFLRAYPEMRVEIDDNDALVDIVAGGFDAGVRLGERLEADMVAVPVGPPMRSIVVASPELLARIPAPRSPQDLTTLPCIRHRFPSGALYRWEFERAGVEVETEIDGPLMLGDVGLMVDAALAGAGLAYVFEMQVAEHLAAGRLVQLLADWCPSYPGMHLYYPSRRQMPATLKAFVDFIREERQA